MARFHIGQRVRIVGEVWLGDGPHPAGREGIIEEIGAFGPNSGRLYDYGVKSGNQFVCADAYELEPLTDTYETTTWDQCAWQPEQYHVTSL